jgi:hypothetical protein
MDEARLAVCSIDKVEDSGGDMQKICVFDSTVTCVDWCHEPDGPGPDSGSTVTRTYFIYDN